MNARILYLHTIMKGLSSQKNLPTANDYSLLYNILFTAYRKNLLDMRFS